MTFKRTGLRFGRRRTDDTFKAFHQACDARDLQTAGDLLLVLEDKLSHHMRRDKVDGQRLRSLLQAQARLWSLRCRSFGDEEEARGPECIPLTQRPATSKLVDWLKAWLQGPQSRFARVSEFSIRR